MAIPAGTQFLERIQALIQRIHDEEKEAIARAARLLADHIKQDKIVYVYGPGGHSNLGSQEIFYRAGGLIHVSAILDEGTLISGGALRSTALERTPGYARIVLDDYGLKADDLLIIVNAYGINSATIDTALEARRRGIKTIGVTSVEHSGKTPADHVARHPSKKNLYELVDIALDCKVPLGDAVVELAGLKQKVAPISTIANAFVLHSLTSTAIELLLEENIVPPVWISGNVAGGDEFNAPFLERMKGRIKKM